MINMPNALSEVMLANSGVFLLRGATVRHDLLKATVSALVSCFSFVLTIEMTLVSCL